MRNPSSLTPVEREVLSLWGEGFSQEKIALRLNYSLDKVRGVIGTFCGAGIGGGSNFEQMTKLGSAALLAAIRKHHPERFQ